MAETYWITFCIADSGAEDRRYQALLATVRRATSSIWWTESVNFLMFHSEQHIDEIAREVAAAFDPSTDLALLSTLNGAQARAIGAIEDPLLFELMPNALRFHPEPAHAPPAPAPSEPSPPA